MFGPKRSRFEVSAAAGIEYWWREKRGKSRDEKVKRGRKKGGKVKNYGREFRRYVRSFGEASANFLNKSLKII